jgi:hypothetical protein
MSRNLSRRDFFKLMGTVFAGGAIAKFVGKIPTALADAYAGLSSPPPAGKKVADPASGPGKTQSYVHLAKDYKGPKRPALKPESNCSNCMHFKPVKAGDAWAPCAVLAQSWVYKGGACALYMKNPKA